MPIQIIESKDRSILLEGRNNGMAFGFLKKNKDTYTTVQPLSPCKDYLNEVVFTENTGIPSEAHGLVYSKKLDIFDKWAYMAIKIMPTKTGNYYYNTKRSIKQDIDYLKNNYPHIEKFINFFGSKLGVKRKVRIYEANDDYFLLKIPIEWCISTISISLFSLLVRVALVYDDTKNPTTYLQEYNYNYEDVPLVKSLLPILENLMETGKLPIQPKDYEKEVNYCPHDIGIMTLDPNYTQDDDE